MGTYQLSKDYTEYKWSFGEKPPKEDLVYLYITCECTMDKIAKILNSNKSSINRWLKFYKINKTVSIDKCIIDKIDWSCLSRNFITEPWKRTDIPVKEDFIYLYLTLNLSVSDIAEILGRSVSQTQKIINKLGIKKNSTLCQKSRENMNLRKYGIRFPNTTNEALKKKEKTNIQRYGVKSLLCDKTFKEKSMLNKYGVKHALESDKFLSKLKNTNKERWGEEYSFQVSDIQDKIKKTLNQKYGTDNVFKIKELQDKARTTIKEKYNSNTYAQAHIKHIEDMNKEFWEKNFYDSRLDAFDIEKCAEYHDISLCTISRKLKEFDINYRTKYASKNEYEIKKYIESFNYLVKRKDRALISPLELDIFVPEKSFAIEFDGLGFHSEGISDNVLSKNVTKLYHLNKTKQCKDKGVQLLHIFENEWVDTIKRDIWKSVIKNKLGISDKIYARNTKVKEISNSEAVSFCDINHLQGGCSSKIQSGLFDKNNSLVAVMTFSKPRYNKEYDWELVRYCCKKGFVVIGGASKLLKAFRNKYKGSIISYANLRWSNGNLYEKLGFNLLGVTSPNYFYFKVKHGILPKDFILHSRIKFQKHKLKDILANFDENMSEKENMFMNGYRLIYDCGNLVYLLP